MQGHYAKTECEYCEGEYTEGFNEDYCSEQCFFSRKGEKALNTIHNDHTKCSTCGRPRAEIELPKPDELFAIEYTYGSAYHLDDGEVSYEAFGQSESAKAAIGFRLSTENEDGGACLCGTIEKTGDGHFDLLGPIETEAILIRISERIKEAAIDGQREDWPSKGELLSTYEETEDLAYSVGVSL